MRNVRVSGSLDQRSPDQVYDLLTKFQDYPKYGTAIIAVTQRPLQEPDLYAVDWVVKFRDGILRWSEHDRFDRVKREIHFRQTHGDIEEFYGRWRIEQVEAGTRVIFTATFDLGIPSLNKFLEPVAEQLLIENMQSILIGFFGDEVVITEAHGSRIEPELEVMEDASCG